MTYINLPRGAIIHQPDIHLGQDDGRMGWIGNWIEDHRDIFDNKSVLDLGSNCGHFPLEYAKAGARRVVAVEGKKPYADVCRRVTSKWPVETCEMDLRHYIVSEPFHVLSALGIIYHVEGIWACLAGIVAVAQPELLLVESETYEKDGQDVEDGDMLNAGSLGPQMCLRPSVAAVEEHVRALGFRPERVMFDRLYTDIRGFWACYREESHGQPA